MAGKDVDGKNGDGGETVTASLFPAMRYRDARVAAEWLERAFGLAPHALFEGPDGTVVHAEMRLGNGLIMFGSAREPDPADPWSQVAMGLYAAVDDIDAHYARAVAAGADIVKPLAETNYGSRDYTVRDLDGHLWSFGTYRP